MELHTGIIMIFFFFKEIVQPLKLYMIVLWRTLICGICFPLLEACDVSHSWLNTSPMHLLTPYRITEWWKKLKATECQLPAGQTSPVNTVGVGCYWSGKTTKSPTKNHYLSNPECPIQVSYYVSLSMICNDYYERWLPHFQWFHPLISNDPLVVKFAVDFVQRK